MNELSHIGFTIAHTMDSTERMIACYEQNVRSKRGDYILSDTDLKSISTLGEQIHELTKDLRLEFAQAAAVKLILAKNIADYGAKDALNSMRAAKDAIIYGLSQIKFLRATPDMAEFSEKYQPFGAAVAAAFLDCSEDIHEAHKCFAFERYAACVFHLGRAMERITKKLAKKMAVGNPDDDWQGFLKAINKAVDKMPYGTKAEREKRAPYAEAAGFSFQFKEAWRNPTAHPKRTYTRQEAMDVLNGARAFMDAVARKIFRVKIPKVIGPSSSSPAPPAISPPVYPLPP